MPLASLPPGVRGKPLIGNLLEFRKDPVELFTRLSREYGDLASFRLGPYPAVLLSRPEYIHEVLVHQHKNTRKPEAAWVLRALFGENLVTLEGDEHRQRRRLMQPAFIHQKIQAYGSTMVELTQRHQTAWRKGQTLDIAQEMHLLSMAIVTKTLLGFDLGSDQACEIKEAMDDGLEITKDLSSLPVGPFLKYLPLPISFRMKRTKKKMDAVISKAIEEKRKGGARTNDLLSLMMALKDEEGTNQRLTDEELRDEALIFFLAGQETVATALTWFWHALGQDPAVTGKVHEEVTRVLGDRAPALNDLPSLCYTDMVLSETMRVYPPVYSTVRTVVNPFQLGNYLLPAGAFIWLSPYVIHHNPAIFPEPTKFIPERWTAEEREKRHKYAFIPFGAGPRICIGASFAWMEALLVIATTVQKWGLSVVPGQSHEVEPFMSYHLKNGLKVTLQ